MLGLKLIHVSKRGYCATVHPNNHAQGLCFNVLCCGFDTSGPFYKHGLTLIPVWISNHMLSKVWDEITYPFLNFNGCTVEV